MIVQCSTCAMYFDDAFRLTYCPHDTFAANDGENRFAHHPDSYLSNPDGFTEWYDKQDFDEYKPPTVAVLLRAVARLAWIEATKRQGG